MRDDQREFLRLFGYGWVGGFAVCVRVSLNPFCVEVSGCTAPNAPQLSVRPVNFVLEIAKLFEML